MLSVRKTQLTSHFPGSQTQLQPGVLLQPYGACSQPSTGDHLRMSQRGPMQQGVKVPAY